MVTFSGRIRKDKQETRALHAFCRVPQQMCVCGCGCDEEVPIPRELVVVFDATDGVHAAAGAGVARMIDDLAICAMRSVVYYKQFVSDCKCMT